jgi:hypothetical protein
MIIILVILAISLPVIVTQYHRWDMRSTENSLRNEIEYFMTRVTMVYLSGENNTANVNVQFKDGVVAKIDWIHIGSSPNNPDYEWTTVSYCMRDRSPQTMIVKDPQIPMSYSENGEFTALELGKGIYTIHLSVERSPVFELGRGPDLYVEVSLI